MPGAPNPPPAGPVSAQAVVDERTAEQVEEEQHVGFIVSLLARGFGMRTVADACRVRFGFGPVRTRNLLRRAREALKVEVEDRKQYAKAEQIARVRARIAELLEPRYGKPLRDENGKVLRDKAGEVVRERYPVNGAQVARFEELLADLEGNREPTRVAVAVALTEAAQRVFAGRSDAELAELANRARERRRLALVARDGEKVA